MKNLLKIVFVFLFCFIFLKCNEDSTVTPKVISGISGTVTASSSGNPIKGASVITVPPSQSITTDDNGDYELKDLSPGSYLVKANKTGYNEASISVSVEEGKTTRGDIQMNATGPVITVQPLVLDFGMSLTSATFAISNNGIGNLNFTITENASWMQVDPLSGSVANNPATITVTVDRYVVGYGNYSDVIQINSNGGNKQVMVNMTKQDTIVPILVVNPTQLNFGTTLGSLQLNITNGGSGSLIWNATKDQSWIQLNPVSGTNAGSITVTVSRNGLPSGQNFNGIITINSTGGNKTIPVTMATGDVSGSWILVKMEGNLQDICLGETANFQNGTATLQCPNSPAITRSYTFINNVLTYTNSGVRYAVSFGSVNGIEKMIFHAIGIERTLTYNRNEL
jgi:hypothetical protein